jgi:alkaline phosphatase D
MFGKGQMNWLIDGLTSSKATFKIIVGGNQMLNPMTPYEAWGHFPVEREKMLNELKARKIKGVFFLSGDRHHTELIRIKRDGTYPLFDYTSSPLLSSPNKNLTDELLNPARVKGTLVNKVRNFGLLRFRGKGKERSVTLSAHGINGKELWEHKILATSLR